MAQAFNLPIVSHVMPEVLVQVVAACPNGLTVEYMPWSFRLFEEVPVPMNGALAVPTDVSREADIQALIAAAEAKFGQVDVFYSNAGISRAGMESASDADWDLNWRVHVLSHVFAARVLEDQPFIKDEQQTVGQYAKKNNMKLVRFVSWELGK